MYGRKLTRANALQEEQVISSKAESFPSMESTTYNLDSLFTTVCHPEEHSIAPAMYEVKGQDIP